MTISEINEKIRRRECEILWPRLRTHLPPGPCRVLELGCGTGVQSAALREFGPVVGVDPFSRPAAMAGVSFVRCDAAALPFAARSVGLVYSSSVLEHIPDLAGAFAEMRRVGRDDAIYVHAVPTHIWKALSLVTHYGALGRAAVRRLLGRRRSSVTAEHGDASTWRTLTPATLRSRLLPAVHGLSASNREELVRFLPGSWAALFRRHGFNILARYDLLLYAPPEFPFVPPNRIGARLGLSSCVAFVMVKAP